MRKFTYTIVEEVVSSREIEVPDDIADEDLNAYFEEDWVQNGSPTTDFDFVRERDVLDYEEASD